MHGRIRPYLPELTIRDYNTYVWYLRGVRRQIYKTYGLYACQLLRHNGVLFALFSDSLAGRVATSRRERMPGTLHWRNLMCQTQGIRLAAQVEVLIGWHKLHDHTWEELTMKKSAMRVTDSLFMRHAYERAVEENPGLERLFAQENEQERVQMQLGAQSYALAAEPLSNIYGALYASLATDDPAQRKSMYYIGSCMGRVLYLLNKADSYDFDKRNHRYNVFWVNGVGSREAAQENARRQALATANDLVRAYNMLDIKLNRSLLDNIMILGLRHAVEPIEQADLLPWELPS